MKYARFCLLLALGVFGTATTSKSGGPEPRQKPRAWTYKSPDYDFSLDFPSAGWKQMPKKRFVADFWSPTSTGSPMLVGVTSVKNQSLKEFKQSAPRLKANAEKGGNFLVKPTLHEGKTASGNPYRYAALREKGDAESQFIYVVNAEVWLADKGITVATVFEGQGRMKSKVFQAIETAEFESAAKSICLSPK